MQINDDDIRAAFAWPVRYDRGTLSVMDANGFVVDIRGWGRLENTYGETKAVAISDYLGEAIAAMLNERFAPRIANPDDECAVCGDPFRRHRQTDGACRVINAPEDFYPSKFRFAPKGAGDGQATDKLPTRDEIIRVLLSSMDAYEGYDIKDAADLYDRIAARAVHDDRLALLGPRPRNCRACTVHCGGIEIDHMCIITGKRSEHAGELFAQCPKVEE